jgi:RNA polymerase sigma-70 factor (ECF subfamily)
MPRKDRGINIGLAAHTSAGELLFDRLVEAHYESLYRFALSLCRREADACDLTQQTFYQWAKKGHQLREKLKVKSWLFRTLYREHLRLRGYERRFVCLEQDEVDVDAVVDALPSLADRIDTEILMQALFTIDELHRAPLVLFYFEDHSYKEISEILNVAAGTVMSRLSRAKELLRKALHQQLDSLSTYGLNPAATYCISSVSLSKNKRHRA